MRLAIALAPTRKCQMAIAATAAKPSHAEKA
jgi:hypothetical protein